MGDLQHIWIKSFPPRSTDPIRSGPDSPDLDRNPIPIHGNWIEVRIADRSNPITPSLQPPRNRGGGGPKSQNT